MLAEFGKAYGRLPQNLGECSLGQSHFLDEAVEDLAENGYVIPVRLSLFAEMIKSREWNSSTLKSLGGTEGIGVKFLEEMFSSSHAPPSHRLHQKAVRAILAALLPTEASDIKGAMCSREALLEAAQYGHRPRDLEEVLKLLSQLRLISPTDPESVSFDGTDSQIPPSSQGGYFQLTHDFLVPAVREWLTQKRRETRHGRALLLLEQREREWATTEKRRLLPSLGEWVQMTVLTNSNQRSPSQQRMLRKAFAHHVRQLTILGSIIAIIALVLVWLTPPAKSPPTQYQLLEIYANSQAEPEVRQQAFDRITLRDTAIFPRVLEITRAVQDPKVLSHAIPRIVEVANTQSLGDQSPKYDAALSQAIQRLLLEFWGHESESVRELAFSHYCLITEPKIALIAIRDHAVALPPSVQLLAGEYVKALSNSDVLNATDVLLEILRDCRHRKSQLESFALLAGCVHAVDNIPPDVLIERMMEQDLSAKEYFRDYLQEAKPSRLEDLGEIVHERFVAEVPADVEEILLTSDSRFLIDALGLIQERSRELQLTPSYQRGLSRLHELLVRHAELSDDDLNSVIESFIRLNAESQFPLSILHPIMSGEIAKWSSQVTVVRSLGEKQNVESLELLRNMARSETSFLNLRVQAVESLALIAKVSDAKKQLEVTSFFQELLQQALDHERPLPESLKNVLLKSYSHLFQGGDCQVLFSYLINRDAPVVQFDVAALEAIYEILFNHPGQIEELLSSYLSWHEKWKALNPQASQGINPDGWLFTELQWLRVDRESVVKGIAIALGNLLTEKMVPLSRQQHAHGMLSQLVEIKIPPLSVIQSSSEAEMKSWKREFGEQVNQSQLFGGRLIPPR